MEFHTCAYTSPNVSNSNSDYYGKINIGSVIMCFIIIYSTALSIILSIIQLIQVIKEEELLNEEEEEEVIKEEEEEVIEEEEEEIIKEVEVEVIKEEEEELINEDDKENNEVELVLLNANYNGRSLGLQAAYEVRAKLTFEKWREAYSKLFKIKQELAAHGGEVSSYTENTNMYRTFMTKMQEEYFQTNEKLTRLEALNALKKARKLDLEHYKEFIHLFNS
jgi:hypothetical protein